MWEYRAQRARHEVAALAASGSGVSDLHAAAMRVVGRSIGTELACWAALDPETLVISTMTSGEERIPAEYEPRLAEAEYSTQDPHRFAALARRRQLVARFSDLPRRDRVASARFTTVWQPLGLDRELRVVFQVDGVSWGAAGMVRTGRDFSDREMEFLAAVAPAIARATRLAVRTEASGRVAGGAAAIVIIDAAGRLQSATPAARDWQDRLDEIAPGRFLVMMHVMAVGARSSTGTFRARLRDARGGWAVLHASPLVGGDTEQIAVAIEPATGDDLTGMLLAAYELSPRERDICAEVMAGRSTHEIADRLFISSHTVQDHLKSVFAKVGVRSRGELVARLRPDGSGDSGR